LRCFALVWCGCIALIAVATFAYFSSIVATEDWQSVYRAVDFYLPIDNATVAIGLSYRERPFFWLMVFCIGGINIPGYAIIAVTITRTYAHLRRQQALMSITSQRIHRFVLRTQTIQVRY
jgi:hypothetical protein